MALLDLRYTSFVFMPEKTRELTLPKELLELDTKEMLKAGVHFGHLRSKRHPKMAPFVFGVRNNVEIIDLEKTVEYFHRAFEFFGQVVGRGGTVLFVGTKLQAQKLVVEAAERCNMPYVNQRWIGGLLTNFETISQRLQYLKELEEKQASGDLEKYRKHERLRFARQIEKLQAALGGIRRLSRLPDAVLLVTPKADHTALKEAQKKKIPIVAFVDTDMDPTIPQYPIPANDDAISSLRYMLDRIAAVIQYAREHREVKKEENNQKKP